MILRTVFAFAFAVSLAGGPVWAADNELTDSEKNAGWLLLFDGQTTKGWRPYGKKLPGGWEVVGGTLHALPKVEGSELITEKTYADFEFAWEWKIPEGGNNGVKYFVTEARPKSPGHEYQMIDDDRLPPGTTGAKHQTASFYDVLPPAAGKPLRPPGEWNRSRIVVRGDSVEHWLNDRNVLTYRLGSEAVKAGLARSKFKDEPGFGDKIAGHIMLTYHRDECWYRNIKIRELK